MKSDFLQFGLRVLGTTIDGIMFGGSAYSTGQLQKGDVIIKMNGNVFSADELSNLLQDGERAGDKLVLGAHCANQMVTSSTLNCPRLLCWQLLLTAK